ncbi:MAG: helix-turn-helix transcriptional regulator [Candidatus Enteromonas sp.]
MNYSKALKQLRLKKMMSQTEMATLLGVSFATVNRIEGNRHCPNYKTQRRIAELCKKAGIKIEDCKDETND